MAYCAHILGWKTERVEHLAGPMHGAILLGQKTDLLGQPYLFARVTEHGGESLIKAHELPSECPPWTEKQCRACNPPVALPGRS